MKNIAKILKLTILYLTSVIMVTVSTASPFLASATKIDCNDARLSANDVVFWNPCDDECDVDTGKVSAGSVSSNGDRDARLKEVVHKYGEYAMNMQREWGTPWELVFAQMVMESGLGTAGIAVNGATNNWLGIKGTGDAGTTGRDAKYSSIEASISDWAGKRVLRNGLYDSAFAHTSPNNYNIKEFFAVMIEVYAPTSDGNDTGEYKSVVYGLLDGSIKSAREEKGWPSSEELAKKENIPVGGKNPLGSELSDSSTTSSGSISKDVCGLQSGAVQGEISQSAINLSWPDRSHSVTDPKPEYVAALSDVNLTGSGCGPNGADCGVFVATVMRASKADTDFPIGTDYILPYLRGHSDYERINTDNTGGLLPGDIFILDGHIMMYVGDGATDGGKNNASASCSERIGDRGSDIYFSDWRGAYEIYRKK